MSAEAGIVTAAAACRVRVQGQVQGVGFRPFVFRLARQHRLAGSVMNSTAGVEIVVEGSPAGLAAFLSALGNSAPPAATIAEVIVEPAEIAGLTRFCIRESDRDGTATVQITPDLPVCDECLRELFDPANRRYLYPYINCANCGPRFSLTTGLPYDRRTTTMAAWRMCADCDREFHDPADRRFHAQPIACPACGPGYAIVGHGTAGSRNGDAIAEAARLLQAGGVLAVKGIGGYHLACDARNVAAVARVRQRKNRKTKPFALMVADVDTARTAVELDHESERLLTSPSRPIVLAPARDELPEVAPGHGTLGVMLPYAPVHHLLFAAGAPPVLVMTSGNRSNEPIAIDDDDARLRLGEISDATLRGERPIARRADDAVVRMSPLGRMVLRRSRGFAPAVVARLESSGPILAVGGDLKNAVAIVVDGHVMVSQHIGDLAYQETRAAFADTIEQFLELYRVDPSQLTIAHDLHPQYASTCHATDLSAARHLPVQHHRAHIASVLAERQALSAQVLGIAFDGTGFGDDGTIWGGEFFVGSVTAGFDRVAHLRPAPLPGGDAAAAFPVQAAAGFATELGELAGLAAAGLPLPPRYLQAQQLVARGVRTFATTSVGRLFDAAAAFTGFVEPVSFEAEAAIWLENQACAATTAVSIPFEYADGELDWRPALRAIVEARLAGQATSAIARGFHRGLSEAVAAATIQLCEQHHLRTVVLTGGVFQNRLLFDSLSESLAAKGLAVWVNREVPAGDGGLSLGQAAIAARR
jgi:hydrogenase maturation protein HypF